MNKEKPGMKLFRKKPPKLFEFFLSLISKPEERFSAIGDFEEIYNDIIEEKGIFAALRWYSWQIVKSFPSCLKHNGIWSYEMFKNYLKIAVRNIRKYKGYSFINIAGLAIGMACCILILIYVNYEFSFDRYHENSDNIYRVLYRLSGTFRGKSFFNATTGALGPAMKENFPEVIDAARVFKKGDGFVKYKNNHFKETRLFYVDPGFLSMFSLPLIYGDSKTALVNPYSIILSQETSIKYFGNEDPIGKTLILDNEQNYQVTGIFPKVPDNTHIKFDLLISFSSFVQMQGEERINDWARFISPTYFQLRRDTDVVDFEKKLQEYYLGNLPKLPQNSKDNVVIQPITKIHFFDKALDEFEPGGDIRTVYLFAAIAFFIMLIACFNYMNLYTARSSPRAKEISMRKVVGASRSNLIKQFLSESIIFSIISFAISLLITMFFLSAFSEYVGRNLTLHLFKDIRILVSLTGIVIFIAIVSGSYPAFFLSSFHPIGILKDNLNISSKRPSVFRNSLVTVQFSVSIALIICTIITLQQLHFMRNRDLGYIKDHILTIRGSRLFEGHNYETIKNELLQYPQILDMTWSSALTTSIGSGGLVDWEDRAEDDRLVAHILTVDYNYFDFYGMEIVKGRSFSEEFITDKNNAYILNEKAVQEIGWEDPIGKKFSEDPNMSLEGPVIGVVKDFHYAPLHLEIQPLHIRLMDRPWGWLSVKISPYDIPETLVFLEEKWKEYVPEYPFEFSFLDDRLNRIYQSEQKLGQSFNGFAFLAVFIACLGLFGLASFISEQRTKEIGIRKVLGASTKNIIVLLSREFLKWVLLSNVIAWPVAYFIMNKWLQDFAYRLNLGVWIFVLSGLVALVIALVTVSYQSIKTATANPIDSLKYE